MPHWRVLMNGRNFWLRVEDRPQRLGFYTTRFVVAEDKPSAELAACNLLRDDPRLQAVLNDRSDPPVIQAEEVVEVSAPDGDPPNAGYAFYGEEPES